MAQIFSSPLAGSLRLESKVAGDMHGMDADARFTTIDADAAPQPNWPDGPQTTIDRYVADLHGRRGFACVEMNWATGWC